MPIIDHRNQPALIPANGVEWQPDANKEGTHQNPGESRRFLTKDAGAVSLTISELTLHPGSEIRMHTHPHDEAVVLLEGSVQMVVGGESRTATPGHTLLAPPGIPHRLVNNSQGDVRMYNIFPTDNPIIDYVD